MLAKAGTRNHLPPAFARPADKVPWDTSYASHTASGLTISNWVEFEASERPKPLLHCRQVKKPQKLDNIRITGPHKLPANGKSLVCAKPHRGQPRACTQTRRTRTTDQRPQRSPTGTNALW